MRPLYYYYIINNKKYKYTCKNKNSKFDFKFYCSDSKCPAIGYLNIEKNEFNPSKDKNIMHIEYE